MKIALVAEWLDGWRGGAETSTLQFIDHLLENGEELHVFTRSRPSPTPNLHVHIVGGASMARSRQSTTFSHRVASMLRHHRFDLVHAISMCSPADIYQPRGGTIAESIERNIALRRYGVTRALKRWSNRLNLKQQHGLALERELLGRGSQGPVVIALSEYVASQLRRHYGVPESRIRLIRNGVDPDPTSADQRALNRTAIRQEYGVADGDLLVLLVAHNFRLKGVQRWMEALALLLQRGIRDVRSLVIGKGDTAAWRRLASRSKVGEHLTFTGPTNRIRMFHHAADLLVHPTYYDPSSRVVLEAISQRIPVITTRWDGSSELLRDGDSGFVLDDPWDVSVLADRVAVLRNADLRQSMAARLADIAPSVDMQNHARQVLELYREKMEGVTAGETPASDTAVSAEMSRGGKGNPVHR